MIGILLSILVTALSLLVVDIIFPGVYLSNFVAALVAGGAIGVINGLVRPVLSLLSLPITILTLGGFLLVINGFCFWLASILVPGFVAKGLVALIGGPIILSLVNTFLNNYFAEKYLTPAKETKELANSDQ